MAPKLRGMLLQIYNVLLNFEIVAILLLVILPNFTRNSIIDFTRSSFLSIGLSHHRRQIGTSSAPPLHYVWMIWLERAVSLSLLIYYHWTTNFTAIVLGFYLMSTLCSSSIAYFMPTINCQELPKNPNLRNTKKGKSTVQIRVGDTAPRLMFWLDRLVGVISVFLLPRFPSFSTVFFYISDFIYLIILALRFCDADYFPRKPDYPFCIERLAIMSLELHCTDQTPNSLLIARNCFLAVNCYYIAINSCLPAFFNKHLIPAFTPKIRGGDARGLQSEKEARIVQDNPPKEKFEVHDDQVENKSWEGELVAKYGFVEHVPEYTFTNSKVRFSASTISKSEIKEVPNEESSMRPREEDLVEVVEETKRLIAENERLKIEKEALEDKLKVERLDHEDTRLELEQRNQILEDKLKVERLDHEDTRLELEQRNQILEDKLKVERLDHEDTRLELEKRNQILEDKLKVERLEHEDTRLEWEAKIQAINATLLKENLKSQALSEEIDDHSEFEKQMVEMIKIYNEDCKRLELENRDIAAKLKDVTSVIGKDQQDLLDCQDILYKCKEECKEWESENIALKIELETANSWYQYCYEMSMTASSWNQYYMESENNYRHRIHQLQQAATSTEYHHQNCLRGDDLHIQSLVEEMDPASGPLYDYKKCIADYKEKCRALEEEQDNLHAKLRSTIASCELYRSMLQDLASF